MRETLCVLIVTLGACSDSKPEAAKPVETKAPEAARPAPAAPTPAPTAPASEPEIVAGTGEPTTTLDIPEGSAYDTTLANAASTQIESGDNDEMKIYKQVRSRISMVNRCYAEQRKLDPKLAGKLTVKLTVAPAPKGNVTTAEVTEKSIRNAEVETCVLGTLRSLAFRREGRQPLSVSLPLVFR